MKNPLNSRLLASVCAFLAAHVICAQPLETDLIKSVDPQPSLVYREFIDINGDGLTDIVGVAGDQLIAYIDQGDMSFQKQILINAPNKRLIFEWATADFDGDGQRDYLVRNASGIFHFRNNGSGFDIIQFWPGVRGGITIGDFDGDGHVDFARVSVLGLEAFLNDSTGTFL